MLHFLQCVAPDSRALIFIPVLHYFHNGNNEALDGNTEAIDGNTEALDGNTEALVDEALVDAMSNQNLGRRPREPRWPPREPRWPREPR